MKQLGTRWALAGLTTLIAAVGFMEALVAANQSGELRRLAAGTSSANPTTSKPAGLLQAQRAARNVKRKMDMLEDRVDHIQSLIHEDHADSNQLAGQAAPSSAADQEQVSADAQGEPAGGDQSASVESPASDSWSPPLESGANSMDSDERPARNESSARQWSSVIKSVIPGKTAGEPDSPPTRAHLRDSPSDIGAQLADEQAAAEERTPKTIINDDHQVASSQLYNQTSTQPTLMGPEFSPNQNYQFFRELNDKNHGTSRLAGGQDTSGFRPSTGGHPQAQSQRHKFQNMTILESDTDLVNSHSTPPSNTKQSVVSQAPGETQKSHQLTSNKRAGNSPAVRSYSVKRARDNQNQAYGGSIGSNNDANEQSLESQPTPGDMADYSGRQNDTNNEAPIQWPAFATSLAGSLVSNQQAANQEQLQGDRFSAQESGRSELMLSSQQPTGNKIDDMSPGGDERRYSSTVAQRQHIGWQGEQAPSMAGHSRRRNNGQNPAFLQTVSHSSVDSMGSNLSAVDLKHRSSGGGGGAGNGDESTGYSSSQPSDLAAGGQHNSLASQHDQMTANQQLHDQMQQEYGDPIQFSPAGNSISSGSSGGAGSSQLMPVSSTQHQDDRLSYQLSGKSQLDSDSTSAGRPSGASESVGLESGSDSGGLSPFVDQRLVYSTTTGQSTPYYQTSDSMQPSNYPTSRQQQLSQMASAALANPNMDINALIQRYQRQGLLGTQYQPAQQHSSTYSTPDSGSSLIRAYQQQAEQQNAHRRYSTDNAYQAYLSSSSAAARPSLLASNQVMDSQLMSRPVSTSDLVPYSTATSFQPVYSSTSLSPSARAMSRAANLQYYRAALAAAASNSRQSPQQYLYPDQSSALSASHLIAQHQPTGQSTSNYGNSLYATAAMNSPSFFEAPTMSQKMGAADSGASESTSNNSPGSQQLQQTLGSASSPSSSSGSSGSYKRSYLNSLFKPSASSRYYYSPTYLSPIGLASPAMHSIYTPTSLAETLPAAIPQALYAMAPSAQYQQYATTHDAQQQQQYQAFAAAAAANGLQPHYMDPDMAESSLVATDVVDPQASSPPVAAAPAAPANDDSASSGKSGKSTTPWSNIAGLLLGILPFGILMASLLPAVTVTGRKKRQLELSARNFSELLQWRTPSRVLAALMGVPVELANANATALINEIMSYSSKPEVTTIPTDRDSRRRSLGTPSSGSSQFAHRSGALFRAPGWVDKLVGQTVPSATDQVATNLTQSVQTNETLNQQQTGVKAKVKKAFNTLNNLIVAAQNIKRKHRSSIMDSNWPLGPNWIKSSLKLENLFNLPEFYKRQLAEAAGAKVMQLLAAQSQSKGSARNQTQEAPKTSLDRQQQKEDRQQVSFSQVDSTLAPRQVQVTSVATIVPPSSSTPPSVESPVNKSAEWLIKVEPARPESKLELEVPRPQVNEVDNSTRHHLEVCLNQFLCTLTVKLNTSLKNSLASTGAAKNASLAEQQLEQTTKKYIKQLMAQIESEHPTVSLSSQLSGADFLYQSAMRDQCSSMYKCVELSQLKRILSKMKLKFT